MATDPLLPDLTLRYADHEDGMVDVHLPTGPARRVVVLLHGGFWKTAYDRVHTRGLARALAEDGFVVVSPEYRRVGPGGAGGWPVTGQDVVDAVRALPELLSSAGVDVDASAMAAVGHSAGGHLALWLATTDAPLEHVVALAPVCDLREAIRRGLGSDAARAFFGEIDSDLADPMLLLDRRPAAAITVLHGTDDDVVPIDLSRGLVARHPWIELVELPADHYDVIEPTGPSYDALLGALRG